MYTLRQGIYINSDSRTWVTSEIPDMASEQSLFITTKTKVFKYRYYLQDIEEVNRVFSVHFGHYPSFDDVFVTFSGANTVHIQHRPLHSAGRLLPGLSSQNIHQEENNTHPSKSVKNILF